MKIRDAQIYSDLVVDIIREKQKNLGVSNYVLAQKTNLSEASLSYIYHHQRRPTLYTLIMITNALNLSLADILRQADHTQKQTTVR